jgi:hypothetical protein
LRQASRDAERARRYALHDEWAVAAHHLGKFKEALELYRRLLDNAQIPVEERERISRNEALCAAKLATAKSS